MEHAVTIFCESANGSTGIPRYIQALTKHLSIAKKPNETILRFTARWLHKIPELDEIGVRYETSKLPGRVQQLLRDKGVSDGRLYRTGGVVHELNYMYSKVPKGTRIIMSVHDIGWRLSGISYGLADDFVNKAEAAIRRADRIITSTKSVKNDVIGLLGVRPERVTVISPGIDPVFTHMEEAECAPLPPKYWLFVGAVTPRKNLKRVVDVLSTMEERQPLVIAGPHIDFLDELIGYAREKGVQIIHISGSTDLQLVHIYKRCTGLLYPSFWEGFGFPIVEAAACGAPVITSNNTSMKEVGEGYAYLINPNSHSDIAGAMRVVSGLMRNERKDLFSRGRRLAERYSWVNTARQHVEVYNEELCHMGKIPQRI